VVCVNLAIREGTNNLNYVLPLERGRTFITDRLSKLILVLAEALDEASEMCSRIFG
jgi:hypothetical protein